MSIVRAKEYLKSVGFEDRVMEFEMSSATVAEAARAVNCQEGEIAKTLSFLIGDAPILILASGDAKIDNSKYKGKFATKAKMIPFENVEELIGHAVGGVCPFGINEGVKVYLDESLKKYDIVYPAAGSSNSAVKLSISELEQISGYAEWIDVCKEM